MAQVNINKSTTITLGLAITFGAIITWAAHVDAQVSNNTERISETLQQMVKLSDELTTTNVNVVKLNQILLDQNHNLLGDNK